MNENYIHLLKIAKFIVQCWFPNLRVKCSFINTNTTHSSHTIIKIYFNIYQLLEFNTSLVSSMYPSVLFQHLYNNTGPSISTHLHCFNNNSSHFLLRILQKHLSTLHFSLLNNCFLRKKRA